jgi:signal transduction histidine kinase
MLLDLLLENAAAYSAPESLIEVSLASLETVPRLSVDAHLALILPAAFQEGEPLLELRVRDRGTGIAPAHLPQLFRRFSRIDQRLTREVNGLGLGLVLGKAIVAQHRGMLWVESTPGEGSTFAVILPHGGALTSNQRHE